ncbi:MAG: hypothetical protein ACIALR_10755 [Blastopirellula sp. JB062]
MTPHLSVYFGPEDEPNQSSAGDDLAAILVGDSTLAAAATKHAKIEADHDEKEERQAAPAEIVVELEELLQLLEDARRGGVAVQDEIQGESVSISRDFFRSLLAYQTLLQPQASIT